MAIPRTDYTEIISSTLSQHPSEIADAVSAHNAGLRLLKRKGREMKLSGGRNIVRPVAYQENGTYTRFSGYGTLNNQASDVFTSATVDWSQIAVAISASGREELMNSGKEEIFNLVKERIGVAKKTAANNFSIDFYGSGALTNQIVGLSGILTTNGQGTIHGIDSGTYTNWRSQVREMAGTNTWSKSTIKGELNTLSMACVRGADHPDIGIFSNDVYTAYNESLQDLQRYGDAEMASAGFKTLKYWTTAGAMDVVHDSNSNFATTAERAYFLNSETWDLCVHKDANWSLSPRRFSNNQDAFTQYILWMGALICKNRKLNGLLIDAA